jgi:hypothetical protein
MRLLHRPIAFALVAPMLALAVTASGFVGLRCRVTGMVSIATCCPAAESDQLPDRSSVDDPGCCERLLVKNVKPPAAAATADDVQTGTSPIVFLAFESRLMATPPAKIEPAADPPHASRPPLRLLLRSLLIWAHPRSREEATELQALAALVRPHGPLIREEKEMSPPRLCKAISRLTLALMTGAAALASSCATEPPPRPAQLDPANPAGPESRPLETSAVMAVPPPAPPREMAPAEAPPAEAPPADEHAGHHPAPAAPAAHEHQHEHGAGGSPW